MAIRADVTLENAADQALVRRGHGTEADIRRTTVRGLVDTRAAMLRLPPEVIEVLGLRRLSRPSGTQAGPVTVRIGDRSSITECSVGRAGSEVVVGHVVLTLLDLVASDGRLVPRHPDGPVWALRGVEARRWNAP